MQIIRWLAVMLLATLMVSCKERQAQPTPEYQRILGEREKLLSDYVRHETLRYENGVASTIDLNNAKIALHIFRRDAATDLKTKILQQEEVVSLLDHNTRASQVFYDNGKISQADYIQAQDRALQARQLLEELKARR